MNDTPDSLIVTGLRRICGHDSRSVDDCVTCEAADRLEALRTQASTAPDGMVPVPREPTEAMLDAGIDGLLAGDKTKDIYRAMIAAAPASAPPFPDHECAPEPDAQPAFCRHCGRNLASAPAQPVASSEAAHGEQGDMVSDEEYLRREEMRIAIDTCRTRQSAAAPGAVDDAMVERAHAAYWSAPGYMKDDRPCIRAALTAALAQPDGARMGGEDGGLRCVLSGDRISIETTVDALLYAARESQYFFDAKERGKPLSICDEPEFVRDVIRALNDEREDGETPITLVFEAAIEQAVEQGSLGIEEIEPEPHKSCRHLWSITDENGVRLCLWCDAKTGIGALGQQP